MEINRKMVVERLSKTATNSVYVVSTGVNKKWFTKSATRG